MTKSVATDNGWSADDIGAKCWKEIPLKMNTCRFLCASVATNHCIYVVGGSDAVGRKENRLDTVECYDTISNKWINDGLPKMKEKRSGCAAVVVQNKIYVMGGYNGGGYLDTMEVLDLDDDDSEREWVILPTRMNTARCCFAAVALEGFIYVFGGLNKTNLSSVEMYDTASDSWEELSPLSTERSYATAAVANGCIYVFGGKNSSTMDSYDTRRKKWNSSPAPSMNTARFGCFAVPISNKSFAVLGGRSCSVVEAYHVEHKKWIPMPSLMVERASGSSVLVDHCVYAIGGHDKRNNVFDSIEKMEIDSLRNIPNPPILPPYPNEEDKTKQKHCLEIHANDLMSLRDEYLLELQERKDRILSRKQNAIKPLKNQMEQLQTQLFKIQGQISALGKEHFEKNKELDEISASWERKIDEKLQKAILHLESLEETVSSSNGQRGNGGNKTIPHELICPITLELMTDPVMAADGHTYERSAIQSVLDGSNNPRSPQTNDVLEHRLLTPNYAVRSMCQNYCC